MILSPLSRRRVQQKEGAPRQPRDPAAYAAELTNRGHRGTTKDCVLAAGAKADGWCKGCTCAFDAKSKECACPCKVRRGTRTRVTLLLTVGPGHSRPSVGQDVRARGPLAEGGERVAEDPTTRPQEGRRASSHTPRLSSPPPAHRGRLCSRAGPHHTIDTR